MSTKPKNINGKTSTPRIQTKPKRPSADKKSESVRNVEEKTVEKKSRNDPGKIQSHTSKEEKEKKKATGLIAKDTKQVAKKPQVVKSKIISSDRTTVSQNSRIVKTQYFPNKNNYAEMLQHLNKYEKGSGDGNQKRASILKKPLPTAKTGVLSREESSESISTSERPRTSTLRKGSIVNENIAGPEVLKIPTSVFRPEQPTNEEAEEDAEYEDDFDSYESDFENVSTSDSTIHNISEISTESTSSSSSEEQPSNKATLSSDKDLERKLDSGNFDLKEDMKKQEFSNLQDLVEKDNNRQRRPESNIKSNFTSLSDEGFEEAKSLQLLNFVSAKKRNERRRSLEVRKRRGEELLNMIKLDSVNFTVFDMPPVPYEKFIERFGNVNSMQIGVQTGEENVEEEVQTDTIETCEKWVQMPPHVSNNSPYPYKFERLGVGPSLDLSKEEGAQVEAQFNDYRLEKFLSNTGGLILDILKEREFRSGSVTRKKPRNTFSETTILFKPPSEFSGRRKISQVILNSKNPHQFLSVHVGENAGDYSRSFLYLWNINDALPVFYMACYGKITSCCFGKITGSVFAGLQNGSVVIWETASNKALVKNVCSMIEGDVFLQCPTFVTDIEKSHCCCVVAIRCVTEMNILDIFDEVESTWKIISLDQEGTIVVWNVMAKKKLDVTHNGGMAYWGGIIMMKNFAVSLKDFLIDNDQLLCNDMFVHSADSRSTFISTNYGSILQCELNKEKTTVKMHTSDITSPVKCLVPCPFSDEYFLAGMENGNILLYSRKNLRPLMIVTNKESKKIDDSIEEIQWSLEKPCIFYTKNSSNIIDTWDLSKSSIFPIESSNFEQEITCMKLSTNKLEKSYMITSTDTFINVHFLNQEHKMESEEQHKKEVKTFLSYVSRL